MAAQAAPNRNANTTICSTSPRAMASMMLAGKVCSSMALQLVGALRQRRLRRRCAASVMPSPGPHQIHRAQSEKQRERGDDFEIEDGLAGRCGPCASYRRRRRCRTTSVPKSSGAMIDWISRRKIVADGRQLLARHPGAHAPSATPAAMPMKIQAVSESRFNVLPISVFAAARRRTSCCGGRIRCSACSELRQTMRSSFAHGRRPPGRRW